MIETDVEVLKHRAGLYIEGIQKILQTGWPVNNLRRLLEEPKPKARHEDIMLVYLGLKPAAPNVDEASKVLGPKRLLIPTPSEPDKIEIKRSLDGFIVWNPYLVKEIIDQNSDLVAHLSPEKYDPFNHGNFYTLTRELFQRNHARRENILEGILCGIPRKEAERYADFAAIAPTVTRDLWSLAEQIDLPTETPAPRDLRPLFDAEDPLRQKIIFLAEGVNVPASDERFHNYIQYIKNFRRADVPGFRFVTVLESTRQYEAQLTDLFLKSGINQRLRDLTN